MIPGVFITGTDTGVGKTQVSLAMLQKLQDLGVVTGIMKPIASGCYSTDKGLRNQDAVLLSKLCLINLPYEQINPYAFEPAIAPHIAAQQIGIKIQIETIIENFSVIKQATDFIVVEGAGGWQVPINANQTMADLARCMSLPVILVVAIRLGCINHAILTYQSISVSGQTCVGWVANCIDANTSQIMDNITAIKQRITSPFLGTIPHLPDVSPSIIASHLSLDSFVPDK